MPRTTSCALLELVDDVQVRAVVCAQLQLELYTHPNHQYEYDSSILENNGDVVIINELDVVGVESALV